MSCDRVQAALLRLDDEDADRPLTAGERGEIEAHVASCDRCRTEWQGQRLVSNILRSRPSARLSPHFAASLASSLDDATGWLGMLDWRAWTFRLVPTALALALVALFFFTQGSGGDRPVTLDDWVRSNASAESGAALAWQQDTTPDVLLEAMLTGSGEPMPAGNRDVR